MEGYPMRMHNPPHPGEILRDLWLRPLDLSVTQAAERLKVSRKTLSEIVNARAGVTAEMALRLEMAFGKSAESWLGHQAAHDLWQMKGRKVALGVRRIAAQPELA
jgi:addiction module HigA family antidote